MKSLQIFALFALLLVGVGSSVGQLSSNECIKANVPFAFSAGNETFPAGEYTVSAVGQMGVLAIRDTGKHSMLIASQATVSSGASEKSKLIFHRYGDRYLLSEIWVQGESRGNRLPRTKLEKELAASASYQSSEVLARK